MEKYLHVGDWVALIPTQREGILVGGVFKIQNITGKNKSYNFLSGGGNSIAQAGPMVIRTENGHFGTSISKYRKLYFKI